MLEYRTVHDEPRLGKQIITESHSYTSEEEMIAHKAKLLLVGYKDLGCMRVPNPTFSKAKLINTYQLGKPL